MKNQKGTALLIAFEMSQDFPKVFFQHFFKCMQFHCISLNTILFSGSGIATEGPWQEKAIALSMWGILMEQWRRTSFELSSASWVRFWVVKCSKRQIQILIVLLNIVTKQLSFSAWAYRLNETIRTELVSTRVCSRTAIYNLWMVIYKGFLLPRRIYKL